MYLLSCIECIVPFYNVTAGHLESLDENCARKKNCRRNDVDHEDVESDDYEDDETGYT